MRQLLVVDDCAQICGVGLVMELIGVLNQASEFGGVSRIEQLLRGAETLFALSLKRPKHRTGTQVFGIGDAKVRLEDQSKRFSNRTLRLWVAGRDVGSHHCVAAVMVVVRSCLDVPCGQRRAVFCPPNDQCGAFGGIRTGPQLTKKRLRMRQRDDLADARLKLSQCLCGGQRAVLVLTYYVDMPLAEAATALDIPVGTMKSRKNRALQALRAAIEAAEREPARPTERVR